MIMFNKRVTNKGVYNNMYAITNNRIIVEHKRNKALLDNVVLNKVDFPRIKHHMRLLNGYHKHISLGMFSSLSIIKQYELNKIQLHVLYQHMLFNSHIK